MRSFQRSLLLCWFQMSDPAVSTHHLSLPSCPLLYAANGKSPQKEQCLLSMLFPHVSHLNKPIIAYVITSIDLLLFFSALMAISVKSGVCQTVSGESIYIPRSPQSPAFYRLHLRHETCTFKQPKWAFFSRHRFFSWRSPLVTLSLTLPAPGFETSKRST